MIFFVLNTNTRKAIYKKDWSLFLTYSNTFVFPGWTGQWWWQAVTCLPSQNHGKSKAKYVTYNLHTSGLVDLSRNFLKCFFFLLKVALMVAAEFWEQGDLERSVLEQEPIVSNWNFFLSFCF